LDTCTFYLPGSGILAAHGVSQIPSRRQGFGQNRETGRSPDGCHRASGAAPPQLSPFRYLPECPARCISASTTVDTPAAAIASRSTSAVAGDIWKIVSTATPSAIAARPLSLARLSDWELDSLLARLRLAVGAGIGALLPRRHTNELIYSAK
jgi:hypothetical protein